MTDNWAYWRRLAYTYLIERDVSPNEARSLSWQIANQIREEMTNEQ